MSKIRNSLGLIVLVATLEVFPDYGEKISFDEYKAKTGINLDDLFGYSIDQEASYLKNNTKLIAIRCLNYPLNGNIVSTARITRGTQDGVDVLFIEAGIDLSGGTVIGSNLAVDPLNKLVWLGEY